MSEHAKPNSLNPEPVYGPGTRCSTRLAYRRHEAAETLGLSLRCFDRLVSAGDLPQPQYAGRIPLWSASALTTWLKGGRS